MSDGRCQQDPARRMGYDRGAVRLPKAPSGRNFALKTLLVAFQSPTETPGWTRSRPIWQRWFYVEPGYEQSWGLASSPAPTTGGLFPQWARSLLKPSNTNQCLQVARPICAYRFPQDSTGLVRANSVRTRQLVHAPPMARIRPMLDWYCAARTRRAWRRMASRERWASSTSSCDDEPSR